MDKEIGSAEILALGTVILSYCLDSCADNLEEIFHDLFVATVVKPLSV